MPPPPKTGTQVGKPNQQERHAALEAEFDALDHVPRRSAADAGARLREALGDAPPLIAIETTFSLLRGTASPARWGAALASLYREGPGPRIDRRGSNRRPSHLQGTGSVLAAMGALRLDGAPASSAVAAPPPPDPGGAERPWALLADRDDLLGVPAACDAWGRGKVGVGASLQLAASESDDGVVVLAAPDEPAYARLCRLLSWRLEEPDACARWRRGDDGALALDLAGVVALVRDAALGARLRALGADVRWRADLRPAQHATPFPVVAVPLVRHLDDSDRAAAPVLQAIRTHGGLGAGGGGNALIDLAGLRASYAGYEDQLDAAEDLAHRLRYVPGGDPPPLHMPSRPGEDSHAVLAEAARAGIRWRYGDAPGREVLDRLARELDVIRAKDFAGYILTVWELARGRRTCGRGSAASSIVVYALGLTNVDPVRYHLLFERFLAPERTDPPDIDIDFPWDERDQIFATAFARYGRERTAMVATHQCMHRWAALREAGRAFGQGDGAISAVRQKIHEAQAYGGRAQLVEPWPAIVAAADAIAGAPRHLGLHCGGLVVTDRPVRELVPVHPAAKAIDGVHVPTIAWEKDGAEAMGFVKIDILGNRSLAVVRDCLADLIEDGVTIDEVKWDPVHDPSTRRIIASGGTMGCFYIESPAMRQLQAKVGSGDFDRLVVHSSIIRPAAGPFIATYVERYHAWRKNGNRVPEDQRREWFPHPALEKLLSESFGVLSYQEDVMLASQELAGFASKDANRLRKALGRSDTAQRLQELASAFVRGCRERGVGDDVIEKVWSMISSFAGYSFTKAHSASYAVVSFQCAWLKAHHPACFMARVIANEGGYYHAAAYIEEARRLGVEVRAPCVLASTWKTRREGPGALRVGFQLVKGIGGDTAARIERERACRPFAGIRDFHVRCAIAADDLMALCLSGALDALAPDLNAAQRRWLCGVAVRDGHRDLRGGQQAIGFDEALADPPALPLKDLTEMDRRWRQHGVLGFLPDAHLLALWRLPFRRWRCADIVAANKGKRLEIVGINLTRKPVVATYLVDSAGRPLPAPKHVPMAFVTIEDEGGLAETVWFPEAYGRFGPVLERFAPLKLVGVVLVEFGSATLSVEAAYVLGGDGSDGAAHDPSA